MTTTDVPAMLEMVRKKMEDIKGVADAPKYAASELEGFGKIESITDPAQIIRALASVKSRAVAYTESAKILSDGVSVPAPAFKINGYTAERWEADLKVKYRSLIYRTELDKLEKVKKELEQHLSAEDKFRSSMTNIAELLGIS